LKTFSNSRLDSFENCPLAFRYHYIDGIKSDVDGIEAFMGSRVHDTLEWVYEQVRVSKVPSKDEILKQYDEVWEKNWHENVRIVREGFTPENYRDTGRKCLEEYYDKYHPFDQKKIVDTEMRISMDLGKGYNLTGFIDRLDMDGDDFEIHDYKTSRSLPTQEKLDKDRQLALYELAVRRKWPDAKKVTLVWHYLQHNKEMRSSRTKEQLDTLIDNTIELIERINATKEFPPNPSPLCNWCDYQDICPQTKHPSKVDTLPPNKYLEDDGVQLVNRYMNLYTQRQEVNKEMEEVTEAILEFAKREGVQVIKGSDHKLSVKFENRPKMPNRTNDPEGFEGVKKILMEMGIWDQVSQISYGSIKSQLDKNTELMEALKDFLTWEEGGKVTKSKLKR
jgi:putative RecB family exonuclease